MEPQTNNEEPAQSSGVPETPKSEGEQSQSNTSADLSEYRTFAILGYIIPFLFFLPLLDEKTKNVPYARFHANQQAILLVVGLGASVLYNFLFGMLMSIGYILMNVSNLAILALMVIGVYNAYNNKMKELPFVGQFRILK